jgi:hypothetical protein
MTRAINTLSLLLSLLLLVSTFTGCERSPPTEDSAAEKIPVASIPGLTAPAPDSPEKLLSYAHSATSDAEKKTALQAMRILFPASRTSIGLAELELAYLQLGPDYRVATRQQCELAVLQYESIAAEFSDIPEISLKALWYLGWIVSDLLHDREKGITYYQEITACPMSASLQFSTPVPWLSVKPEQSRKSHAPFVKASSLNWADLAHLEIIRNTTDPKTALSSLKTLFSVKPAGLVTGLGIKAALLRHDTGEDIDHMRKEFLARSDAGSQLVKDLAALGNSRAATVPEQYDKK